MFSFDKFLIISDAAIFNKVLFEFVSSNHILFHLVNKTASHMQMSL